MCVIGDQPEMTVESLELNEHHTYSWRNMFSCINLLRILNKLTKWKHSRIMVTFFTKHKFVHQKQQKINVTFFYFPDVSRFQISSHLKKVIESDARHDAALRSQIIENANPIPR